MTLLLIVGIVCLLLGFLIGQLVRTTKVREKNQEIEKEEQQAQMRIKDLEKEYFRKDIELGNEIGAARTAWEQEKNKKLLTWADQEADLKAKIAGLESQIEEKKKSIENLEAQTTNAASTLEANVYDVMIANLMQKENFEIDHYKYLSEQAQEEYEKMLRENMEHYTSKIDKLIENYNKAMAQLDEAKSKADAAVEVNKRAELDRQEKDFYRLQLSEIDLEEIKRIKSIEPYLRKKEPLNKVIWKIYYEKPCTDLIGRVVGQGRKTGIYKITNIENGMCYIGQAVDIAERWKQHIKRGIGADPPTQNKLYPAMLAIGVENFTFEIIEQCDGNLLNEREDYWQTFYHAKDFGYSIK